MTKPTIHSNGDKAETLAESYHKAARAIQAAIEALADTHPNARNFYPQGQEAIRSSRQEHADRLKALDTIREDMEALCLHCQDIADAQDKARRPILGPAFTQPA